MTKMQTTSAANLRQVLGQVARDLHVSQQHLPRWPWLAKKRFFGVVFEKQWTSLALPATGLQFLAGNGPFLALSQTRPAAAPHLQHPNGPPCAEKAPGQTRKPPTHLATSAWQGIMGPCNAQHRALGLAPKFGVLGTLHIPQQFPPFCPALRLRHTLPRNKNGKTSQNAAPPHCGGATWLWFGALDHNMAGLRGATKSEKCH